MEAVCQLRRSKSGQMASGALCQRTQYRARATNCSRCKITRAPITAKCSSKTWHHRPTVTRVPTSMVSNCQPRALSSQLRFITFVRGAVRRSSPCPCSKTAGRQAGPETCPSSTTSRATTHCEHEQSSRSKDNAP